MGGEDFAELEERGWFWLGHRGLDRRRRRRRPFLSRDDLAFGGRWELDGRRRERFGYGFGTIFERRGLGERL